MSARSVLDRGSDLRDRAEEVRDRASELYDRRDEAVERAEEVTRQGRVQLWRALRALFGLLLVVPRLVLRAFSSSAELVVRAVDRGEQVRARSTDAAERLAERARLAADAVPSARATRWRARRRGALWLTAAFGAGVGTGWYLAGRSAAQEQAPQDAAAAGVASDPSSNGHQGAPTGSAGDLSGAREGDDRG